MNYRELSLLFKKLVKNECTEEEADLVLKLLADRSYDNLFRQLAEEQLKQTETVDITKNDLDEVSKNALNRQLDTILSLDATQKEVSKRKIWQVRTLYAAATILLFLLIGSYLFKTLHQVL